MKTKIPREYEFLALWRSLASKYCDVVSAVKIIRDNRIFGLAETRFFDDGTLEVAYNWKNVRRFDRSLWISLLLHEIGHIQIIKNYRNISKHETFEEKVIDEVNAERFALKIMEMDYLDAYMSECRKMKNALKAGRRGSVAWDLVHKEAWKRIPDYQ